MLGPFIGLPSKENGFDIGEQKSANVPAELLEEVFELNMALEELRSGDEEARPQLESAQRKFAAMHMILPGLGTGARSRTLSSGTPSFEAT